MKKHELENKIESAINSLDHVSRVGPGPFFYTRVRARLSEKNLTFWEKIAVFMSQPAVAFTTACFIISLNTFVIFKSETAPVTSEQTVSNQPDDSGLDVIAFYDEENYNTDSQ